MTTFEQLCGMATVYRQNKSYYTEEELNEILSSINFLIGKIQKVTGVTPISGKLNFTLPKIKKL